MLATALFAADLIDEIILKVNPVLFGAGIPLFSSPLPQTELELIDSKLYSTASSIAIATWCCIIGSSVDMPLLEIREVAR